MQEQEPSLTGSQNGASGQRAEDNPDSGLAPERATETVPSLEEMLRKAELQAQEHHDAWLRAKAEADNIRKRAQLDVANAHKYAGEGFAGELLAVKDGLEAAMATDNASIDSLKHGVELTLKQLTNAFGKFNVRELNPLGEKFDPQSGLTLRVWPIM